MSYLIHIVTYLGDFFYFCVDSFLWLFRRPFRWRLFIEQFNSIGVDSIPIISLVSVFTGMVFALQTTHVFRLFNAESMVGATVGLSLAREIAPVFAALMITARMGSAMAAELGTMRVSEQIDAMESMAVYPHQYLVVPRVFSMMLMVPFHTILFNFIGVVGAYFVGVILLHIPSAYFTHRLEQLVEPRDIMGGVIKAVVFGFFLGSIACFEGFRARGGARGVGIATTRAVVLSSVCILVSDYFLSQVILEFIQKE